jgi:hypothetical protein
MHRFKGGEGMSYYLLDGERVDFSVIIDKAKAYGYCGNSCILTTSEAARVLRENGHTIESCEEDNL